MKYQWGYVGDGHCARCSALSELWVVSLPVRYGDVPQCAYCMHIIVDEHYRFMDSSDCSDSADILELKENNPLQTDNYGVREPWCVGCGHLLGDTATEVSVDSDGEEHTVHANCIQCCDDCDEYAINNTNRYTVFNSRFGKLGNPYISFVEFSQTTGGSTVCNSCSNNYYSCESCGDLSDPDYMSSFDDCYYCEGCYERYVCFCDSCEESYWYENNHYCENAIIKSWDYKPNPNFYGHRGATYYLGLELEVENTSNTYDTEDTAEEVQSRLGDHAYLKHDGSISDGFEIVTHPHTLEKMRTDIDWSVLNLLRDYGFRSWNAQESSCGIHVHVSRTAFGTDERRRVADHRRDAHILRFMKLIYDNQRQVERLAGRSSSRWANFSDKGQLVNKVKRGQQENGRYSAVNTDNYNTLEVRVFKGSLKKERVMSALEFVTAAVEYTRDLKVTGTNRALDWSRFVSYVVSNQDTYPNLLSKISDSLATETINN